MNCIKGIRENDGARRNNLLRACGGFCLLGSEKQKARSDPLALALALVELGCHVHYIDNKSLLLSRPKPRKKRIKMSSEFWQNLSNPAARLIMALQTHFGLTFQEAIHFKMSSHVQHNRLSIAERVIPICIPEQEIILHELKQLVGEEKSLLKKYGQQYIRISWQPMVHHYLRIDQYL
ncbi:TPA: hypothetical protein ACJ5DT_001297 [Legionella pneumophila]|uniref:hypothetical protein n=1 Tax=Legionella pneumophila TaxID=446 RepID=UPI000765C773|nr:hypothetical protein [Legionella pneumophila]APF01897.1 hypothetical protein BIZ52_00320 [Legionella pneumophila subsp. fraseri]APF04907.1 hypothetical protein BIZ51_00320 [Legionella pneumophila subsp. fraseri]AUB67378.1 hypothetical protein BJK09_00325 [Legionella pneumophila]AUB70351.1 hypothetical protein BJK08_00325 [Legionella pneumophila]KZX33563.1 hypothetical protein PtVFX2014_09695 [Legionella pneumophila]